MATIKRKSAAPIYAAASVQALHAQDAASAAEVIGGIKIEL